MDISEMDALERGLRELSAEKERVGAGMPPAMRGEAEGVHRKMSKCLFQLFVLALLMRGETYGYEILRLAGAYGMWGRKMSASRVYPLLHGMEGEGLIKGEWEKRKRVYHITPKGRKMTEFFKEFQKTAMRMTAKFIKIMFNEEITL
jgi:DNA-binding PadR family transcriptional regulator